MAGPSWLAGTFAAVMILTSAYSASRLAVGSLRGRATEFDADALHAVMGVAMAGMLVPRLSVLPHNAWAVVFGIGAAWFGWHAVRLRRVGAWGNSRCRFPVPHLIECAAMIYMLLPVHGSQPSRGAGMAMPGMGASGGPATSFPALAAVLALFMVGYIVWTTDRLATLARFKTAAAGTGRDQHDHRSAAVPAAVPRHDAGRAPSTPAAAQAQHRGQAGRPVLAPKLAAFGKLAMSITMGYMLILMI